MRIFVSCAPGLEPLLVLELAELGINATETPGGADLEGDLNTVYRSNLQLGMAQQVLVRLATFKAKHFAELVKKAKRVEWEAWVDPRHPIVVRATSKRSRLYHSGGIIERVRRAIAERLDTELREPEDGDSGIAITARVVQDEVTLSVDTSGAPLHKRGYRLASGKAPLREDLARALLWVSGWDRKSRLVDPMTGAGTLPIEAALLATGRSPGGQRSFAFEQAPCFDAALWSQLRSEQDTPCPPIFGSDRVAGGVEAARSNAERAGVHVQLDVASLSQAPGLADLPSEGALLLNPPWGLRLGRGKSRGASPLLRRVGEIIGELPEGWSVGMVAPDTVARQTKVRLHRALTTRAGGKHVGMFTRRT